MQQSKTRAVIAQIAQRFLTRINIVAALLAFFLSFQLPAAAHAQTPPAPTGVWCSSAVHDPLNPAPDYDSTCHYASASEACAAKAAQFQGGGQVIGMNDTDLWWIKGCSVQKGTFYRSSGFHFACSASTDHLAFPGKCIAGAEDYDGRAPDDPHQPDDCAKPTGGRTPHPIDVLSGSKLFENTDYSTADGQLRLRRLYNSTSFGGVGNSIVGPIVGLANWNFDFQFEIQMNQSSYAANGSLVTLLTPSGGAYVFQHQASGMVPYRPASRPNPQTDYTLTFLDEWTSDPIGATPLYGQVTHWKVVDSDGRTFTFQSFPDATLGSYYRAVPTQIVDRYGASLILSYSSSGRLQSVTDNYGKAITFDWMTDTDGGSPEISAAHLPNGNSIQYNYNSQQANVATSLSGYVIKDTNSVALDSRTYQYGSAFFPWMVTGITDSAAVQQFSVTYDNYGRATESSLAGGVERYQVAYGSSGNTFTRTVTNPLGKQGIYTYSRTDLATYDQKMAGATGVASTNCPSTATSLTYGSDGFVSSATNDMNASTSYTWDARGNRTGTVKGAGTPLAQSITASWEATGKLPSHIVYPNLTVDFVYDAQGRLQSRTETDATTQTIPYSTAGQTRSWTYGWNSNGRLLSINGPKGLDATGHDDITNFGYDTSGNLQTSTDALGHVTYFANYDVDGRPGKMTDPNGIDTLYTYDPLGRVKTITVKDPAGASGDATTTLTYDVDGRVTSVAQPATKAIVIGYDPAGRVTSVGSLGAEKITYDYDGISNVTAEKVIRGDTTTARQITRTFDELGRLLATTLGPGRTATLAYDRPGSAITVTAGRSNATVLAFDGLNRLKSALAPDSGTTGTNYDARDNATSFTDAKSIATTFIRDGFGDVIREISLDRGTSTYYYDAAGDRIAEIDGRGQRIDLVRDALGRITQKTPVGRPAAETLVYRYDIAGIAGSYGVGRLGKIVNGAATSPTKFKYDHRGNLLIKEQVIGATVSADLQYSYDLADRITSITYPSGRVVSYTRNTRGQVTTIKTRPTAAGTDTVLASGITYEAFGSLLSATLGNGLTMAQGWGNDGRLASKRLYNTAGGTNLSLLTYGYDNDDNITSIADGVDPTRSATYVYDPVNRLTRSVLASGSIRRQDFGFDLNGNRTGVEQRANPTDTLPVSTAVYTLNSGTNQLASVVDASGTRAIAYDARGNTLGETRPTSAITAGYDGYGRLISYQTTGGASLVNAYDGLDDRVSAGTSADMRQYIYDGDGRMMGEYGVSAADVKAETIWLSPEVGGDQPWGGDDGVGGYAPLAVVTGTAGTLSWVHGNHLGVPITMTDSAGNLAAPTGYTPVGFPGQTLTLADLYYNQYRDYDPTTGRYIQADPIGLSGGSNPYSYALGNPLKNTDPHGKFIWILVRGAAAGALTDLGIQLAFGDGSFACVNWGDVAFSGFLGAATAGFGEGWIAVRAARNARRAELGAEAAADAVAQGPRFARGELRQQVLDKGRQADGSVNCAYCGEPTATASDHVVPYAKGGPTNLENLEPACVPCNSSKGAKDLGTEWVPPILRNWIP